MKRPFYLYALVTAISAMACAQSRAQVTQFVDFSSNGVWNHGGTPSNGWAAGQLNGIFAMSDGNTATMNVSFAGTASPASGNLSNINEGYFTGFAIQMLPSSNTNTGTFSNYERIDLVFATPVQFNQFTIIDVDRSGDWDDVIFAEAWSGGSGVGALGTGTTSTYGFNSPTNLATETILGYNQVKVATGGGLSQADPLGHVSIDFSQPVKAMSLYYSNGLGRIGSATQTIGFLGNGFTVTTVPEPSVLLLTVPALSALLLRRRRLS